MKELNKERKLYFVWRKRSTGDFSSLLRDCVLYDIEVLELYGADNALLVRCDEQVLNMPVLELKYEEISEDVINADKTKPTMIVVHGLGGGVSSKTCVILKEYFKDKYNVVTPEIPIIPREAYAYLRFLVKKLKPAILVGTSLGGFYSLCASTNNKIFLINPALRAYENIKDGIGLGTYPFNKPRLKDVKQYRIDKDFLYDLASLEHPLYRRWKPRLDSSNIFAIFGENDELFNNVNFYKDSFTHSNYKVCPNMSHSLTEEQVKTIVIPSIEEFLK